ncbi:MAG: DMT family transporter [Thermomicrobiales bacterium]
MEHTATPLRKFLPELGAFLVVLMWGSTFVLTKDAFEQFRPLAFTCVRFLAVTLLSFIVLFVRSRLDPRGDYFHFQRAHIPRLLASGLFGYTFYQLGFTLGVDNTSAFASSLMLAMMPLVSLVLATLLGRRPPSLVWVGVLVAISGVIIFLLDGSGGSHMLGNLLSFGAAISFALYTVINQPLVRAYPAETFAAYSTLAGAVPLMLVSLPEVMKQDWGALDSHGWLVMLYMVIFPVYVAYMLWNWVISQRGIAATGWQLLVPVISGLLGIVWLHESLAAVQIVGGGLAIVGLVIMRQAGMQQTMRPQGPATPPASPSGPGSPVALPQAIASKDSSGSSGGV